MTGEFSKIAVSPRDAVVPRTPILVGTMVDDRPNFITAVTMGWVCFDVISVSLGRKQFSAEQIRKHLTFSVNFPSAAFVEQLDHCGMHSGREYDKSQLFSTSIGSLEHAPMIDECPVSFTCKVEQVLEKPQHVVFIGEVVDSFVHKSCLKGDMADVAKTHPVLYSRVPGEGRSGEYFSLGSSLGKAWSIGDKIPSCKIK